MPDEKPKEEEVTYYDEIRADIETAVYAFASLEEVDTALFSKAMQKNVSEAKRDCVFIICKGLKSIKDGYRQGEDEE